MTIDPEKLLALDIPEVRQRYTERDTILYALGIGMGLNPIASGELRFVDETKLVAFPTMTNVLAYPGFWMRDLDTGIDWVRLVHGEQSMQLHRPIPVAGEVIGKTRVVDIIDKGPGKGALIYAERVVFDAASGEKLATLLQTVFCRGDGGFGGNSESSVVAHPLPDRAPDVVVDLVTHPQLALIYRLSGDYNPLHSDPEIAQKAGYDRPILHGLATYGVAGHAIVSQLCDYEPARLKSMQARFSAVVFPGDILTVEMWREGRGVAAFRASVAARKSVVLTNGRCEFQG